MLLTKVVALDTFINRNFNINENACGMPQSGQKKGLDLVKPAELEYLFGYRARPVIRGFKNSKF